MAIIGGIPHFQTYPHCGFSLRMINHDQVLSLRFWSTQKVWTNPIPLWFAREFLWNLWPPCAASLLVFSSLMAACWACLIFFPGRNGLAPNPQRSPNSKTMVIHQLGISARGPSLAKVTLLGLLDPNGCSQHKLQEWWMMWLTGWHSLSGRWAWSISQIVLRDTILSFTRHWLSCPST